ncbi:MAG TPA: hypothetical protein PK796_02515 [Bacteroidales bacterium]|nr:hypothetical protein [Bacteroidales bacterium]
MARTFTLTPVVSKQKESKRVHRTASDLPSEETMNFIFGYSRALQVLQNNLTGRTIIILN